MPPIIPPAPPAAPPADKLPASRLALAPHRIHSISRTTAWKFSLASELVFAKISIKPRRIQMSSCV
ncbi:MAG: hypothetical protein LW850_23835 [Planctomycetaceae bacterium]|nr:hypothetical protein [Planctomycetaceae bacterium]